MRKSSIAFKMSTIRCGYWYVLLLLLLLWCSCCCCCCCSAVQRTVSWILHVAIYLLIYFAFACKQTKHKFAQCHLPIANWHCPHTHLQRDACSHSHSRYHFHFHSRSSFPFPSSPATAWQMETCQRCLQFCSQLALIECEHKNIL